MGSLTCFHNIALQRCKMSIIRLEDKRKIMAFDFIDTTGE